MSKSIDIRDLQLNALLEVTQAVNNNLPEDHLFKIYKFTLLADLKISRLAMFTEQDGEWKCQVHFGTTADCNLSKMPEIYRDLKEEQKVENESNFFSEFDSVFPVYHKNKLLAIVFLSDNTDLSVQNRFLNALTNIILVAIENKKFARQQIEQEAYRRELEIAKKVQNFLFPKELPKIDRLQIEAFYLPHHDVGGDYYDYIKIDENKFMVCIADVSGKGVPAALLMSNFQASLRTLIRQTKDLKEIVTELNLTTFVSGNAENFITFFAAIYNFETAELEYINCGHNEIILKEESKLSLLNDGTTVLGMFDPLPFLESKKILNLKDFFLFTYTDGLTETFNDKDEEYGFERLMQILDRKFPEDLSDLHSEIVDELNSFKGLRSYHDDITMLSCRIQNK